MSSPQRYALLRQSLRESLWFFSTVAVMVALTLASALLGTGERQRRHRTVAPGDAAGSAAPGSPTPRLAATVGLALADPGRLEHAALIEEAASGHISQAADLAEVHVAAQETRALVTALCR